METVEVDGQFVVVRAGITVAAALLDAGIRSLRKSPTGLPRGAFCMMGVCQECLIEIDGRMQQACLVPVARNMRIVTGAGS